MLFDHGNVIRFESQGWTGVGSTQHDRVPLIEICLSPVLSDLPWLEPEFLVHPNDGGLTLWPWGQEVKSPSIQVPWCWGPAQDSFLRVKPHRPSAGSGAPGTEWLSVEGWNFRGKKQWDTSPWEFAQTHFIPIYRPESPLSLRLGCRWNQSWAWRSAAAFGHFL